MRLAVDCRALIPPASGIGRFVSGILEQLSSFDISITLLLPQRPVTEKNQSALDRFADNKNTSVMIGNYTGAAGRFYWSQRVLPLLCKRESIDILWGPANRLPPLQSPIIRRVVTIHDMAFRQVPSSMSYKNYIADRLLIAPSLRRADAITTVSDATNRDVRAFMRSDAKEVHTIYPGATAFPVPDDSIENLPALARRDFLLFVGTIEPRKNLHRLLLAYAGLPAPLRSKHPLVIVGNLGWRHQSPDHLIEHLGLRDNALWLNTVSDSLLAQLYKRCLFLAMPSLFEGFGFPLIEANSFGKAALTSHTSSMPEIANTAASFIDPYSVDSIGQGLRQLLLDDTFRNKLADGAKANAQRFSWATSTQKLVHLFRSLVERESPNFRA